MLQYIVYRKYWHRFYGTLHEQIHNFNCTLGGNLFLDFDVHGGIPVVVKDRVTRQQVGTGELYIWTYCGKLEARVDYTNERPDSRLENQTHRIP